MWLSRYMCTYTRLHRTKPKIAPTSTFESFVPFLFEVGSQYTVAFFSKPQPSVVATLRVSCWKAGLNVISTCRAKGLRSWQKHHDFRLNNRFKKDANEQRFFTWIEHPLPLDFPNNIIILHEKMMRRWWWCSMYYYIYNNNSNDDNNTKWMNLIFLAISYTSSY